MSGADDLLARREALRRFEALPQAPAPPPEPEPEDVRARNALREFLAGVPLDQELSPEQARQAEALAAAWVQAVRARDKQARRRERRLAAGREWPED